MLDRAAKAFFHLLAQSTVLKRVASGYGMRPGGFARRFVAGETVAEALASARALQERHFLLTLDLLGESVTTMETADAATRQYVQLLDAVIKAGFERNVSLKLTQLGLEVDTATAIDNVRKILERAEPAGFFVRIDMEGSAHTEPTLEIVETLCRHGYHQIGAVLQAALLRSGDDLPGPRPGAGTPDPDDPFRVSDALRRQARSADRARGRRVSRQGLRAVRPRMVSVLHASAGRTAGKCRLRPPRDSQRSARVWRRENHLTRSRRTSQPAPLQKSEACR